MDLGEHAGRRRHGGMYAVEGAKIGGAGEAVEGTPVGGGVGSKAAGKLRAVGVGSSGAETAAATATAMASRRRETANPESKAYEARRSRIPARAEERRFFFDRGREKGSYRSNPRAYILRPVSIRIRRTMYAIHFGEAEGGSCFTAQYSSNDGPRTLPAS
jgi:hypothetical protein